MSRLPPRAAYTSNLTRRNLHRRDDLSLAGRACYASERLPDGELRHDEETIRMAPPLTGSEGRRATADCGKPTGIDPLALDGGRCVMNRWPGLVPETLPIEIRQRVVAACERFESAWRGGERPAIELYLEGLGPVERTAALHGLVALEFKLRREEQRPSDAQGIRESLSRRCDRRRDGLCNVESAHLRVDTPANGIPIGPPVEGTELVLTASGVGESTIAVGGSARVGRPSQGSSPPRLGRYQVVRLLGEGSFGSVYLARDGELDRDVAIKVPTTLAHGDARSTRGFTGRGPSGGRPRGTRRSSAFTTSAAMTTARSLSSSSTSKGRPSADLLGRGRVEAVRLAGLIASIADAVHHAHRAGLVHRDLKPANIMIDEQGKPRVADFGLAITEDLQTDRAGEVAGTPNYMAPEQVRGEAHRLDGRTDIWAIGVILYEGLTGRLPFIACDRAALFDEILHRDPKPPRQIDDSIPRELERICLRCLCKRMPDRYSSSIDLADDLRAWLADGGFARRGAPTDHGRPAPRRRRAAKRGPGRPQGPTSFRQARLRGLPGPAARTARS